MLRKMIREEIQKMDEMMNYDPSMGQYGSPEEEELMRLKEMCEKGDQQACMQASEMEQYMYGQGGRMFESKRKKNG